jgi:hypothetical protein
MVAQRARAAAVPNRGPGPPPTPADQHPSRQHRSRPACWAVDRTAQRRGSPPGLDPFPWYGCPPHRPGPNATARYGRRRTHLDRRADTSRLDAGRVDTRGPGTGRVDRRRPDRRTPGRQTPGDRTPDGLDTGRLDRRIPDDDTGWGTPDAGHRPATDAVAGVLAVSTRATMPDRWMSAGRSAGQTPSGRATTATVSCR